MLSTYFPLLFLLGCKMQKTVFPNAARKNAKAIPTCSPVVPDALVAFLRVINKSACDGSVPLSEEMARKKRPPFGWPLYGCMFRYYYYTTCIFSLGLTFYKIKSFLKKVQITRCPIDQPLPPALVSRVPRVPWKRCLMANISYHPIAVFLRDMRYCPLNGSAFIF